MKITQMGRRITLGMLIISMVFSLSVISPSPALADAAPNPIQSTYVLDGVTYYDVGSTKFATYPEEYLIDLMGTASDTLGGSSLADLWLYTAAGISFEHGNGNRVMNDTSMATVIASDGEKYSAHDVKWRKMNLVSTNSLKQAEEWAHTNIAEYSSDSPNEAVFSQLQNHRAFDGDGADDPQTVLVTGFYAIYPNDLLVLNNSGDKLVAAVVYFSDFEMVAVLPSNEGDNYVTETVQDDDPQEKIVASNVKNLTGTNITAEQSLAQSYSASMTSTVEGSESYTLSESLKYGIEYGTGNAGFRHTVELQLSASEAFSSGWSESKAVTDGKTTSAGVSIEMPPYTNVMLSQKNGSEEILTRYNCPVGLKYKATVVLYDPALNVWNMRNPKMFCFEKDSRADLKKWALDLPDKINPYNIDFAAINSTHSTIQSAEETIAGHVPMSSVGAAFSVKLNTVDTEVSGLMPIYKLAKIKLLPPDGILVGTNYGNLEYLKMDMKVGDHDYTSKFQLQALNELDYEYYGFSRNFGHWVVTDGDGNEWTNDETCPVALSGKRFTAVRPGSCFLKYVINEDVYDCVTHISQYATNADLLETAMIEIIVTDEPSTVEVEGSFTGYVGEDAVSLEQENGLSVTVCDASGKETDAAYVWEKKEADSKGITLDEAGQVAFTKEGTFHVRAVCETLGAASEWVEITAKHRTFDVTFDPKDGSESVTVNVISGNAVTAPDMEDTQCRTFGGWFTDTDCTEEADLLLPVTADLEIYGKWTYSHDPEEVEAVPADCEHDGAEAHFACRICGALFSDPEAENEISEKDIVIPGGHKMTRIKRKAATCTEAGNIEYFTCSECGGFFADRQGAEELPEGDTVLHALGHRWDGGEITTPASCEKAGVKTNTCLNCGKTAAESVKASGHDWTEWKTVREATGDKEGEQQRTCANDPSHVETRSIPVPGHRHTLVRTDPVKAGCETEGNITYYTCSGCGWIYADRNGTQEIEKEATVLEPTGHDWSKWEVVKEATSDAAGIERRVCGNDPAHVETRSIPKLAKGLVKDQFIRIYSKKITKKAITVGWTKLKDAVKYELFVGACGDAFKDSYSYDRGTNMMKISQVDGKKLNENKTYRFYVIAYGEDSSGKLKEIGRSLKIYLRTPSAEYGNYSKIKLKSKSSVKLKAGGTAVVKAEQSKKKRVKVKKYRGVYYQSSNPAVASVGVRNGKVKAKSPGTCKIYCISQNGLFKTVKVTVK